MNTYHGKENWLTTLVFLCLLSPFFANAQSLIPIGKSILAKRQQIEKLNQQIDEKTAQYQENYSKIQGEQFAAVADLNKQIAELIAEKERTREELQQGLFCSQCKRSKSKIERETKQSFQAHLTSVKGVAEPMPLSEIMKQMADYDNKIAQLEARRDAIEKRYQDRLFKLTDNYEEAIINAELRLAKSKAELATLENEFKLAHQAYLDNRFNEDKRWLTNWLANIERARVAMLTAQRGEKLTLEIKTKQLDQLIANNANVSQVDALKQQIAASINLFQTKQQSAAAHYNQLVATLKKDKQTRLEAKRQHESAINAIIDEVGLVAKVNTEQNLVSKTHYASLNTERYFSKLNTIFSRINNQVSAKVSKYQSEQSVRQSLMEKLARFRNDQKTRLENLFAKANTLFKRIDGTSSEFGNYLDHTSRKGVFTRWRKNIGRDLEKELIASGVQEFINNDFKPNGVWLARYFNENKLKTSLQNIGILMARRGVHNYIDAEFRRKYPDPDEYYKKAWALRNIDPDIGIASWFDFTNTKENEGVKGYLNEVFAPFHKMMESIP